jgi:uncharacterized membrane protein
MDKDRRLYDWIALGLRIAICVAVVLLVVGAILCGIRGIEPGSFVFSLPDFSDGRQAPLIIIGVGVLLLLLTPLLGIVLGVVAFALARDRLYLAISIAILGFLIGFVLAEM